MSRAVCNLTLKDHVCELNFLADCIVKEKVFKEVDEKDIQIYNTNYVSLH